MRRFAKRLIVGCPEPNKFIMLQRAQLKICLSLTLLAALVLLPQNVFASTQSRMIFGSVISAVSGHPVEGVMVTASHCASSDSTVTGSDGSWQLTFPYATYGTLTFDAPGYRTQTYQITYNSNLVYSGGIISLVPG